jgi:hypothetical protein
MMPLAWAKLEAAADRVADLDDALDRQTVVLRLLDEALDVAAGQERKDHVGLAVFLTNVVDRDDVRVVAESAHGLRLACDASAGGLIQALGLDQGEGNVAVEGRVVGEVDLLLAALAEELAHFVAAVDEGGRLGSGGNRGWWSGVGWRRGVYSPAGGFQIGASIPVLGVEGERCFGTSTYGLPVLPGRSLIRLVQQAVNLALDSLAGQRRDHCAGPWIRQGEKRVRRMAPSGV